MRAALRDAKIERAKAVPTAAQQRVARDAVRRVGRRLLARQSRKPPLVIRLLGVVDPPKGAA